MKKVRYFFFSLLLGLALIQCQTDYSEKSGPKISFTFDDGNTSDKPNLSLKEWNEMLLANLKKHDLKAVLFANGSSLRGAKGAYVLSSWNDEGHKIANHTYSHPNFNSEDVTLLDFKNELIKNDSIIRTYDNYFQYFRFPFLKEGNTLKKRDGFREFLQKENYKNGHVSIDASDWYIDGRLKERMKHDSLADISGFKKYYIQHIYDRALYYDSLSTQLTGRKINHVLLLHHNLAAALFLDDLITHFKNKGWQIVNTSKAYKDDFYTSTAENLPAGESLIWAMAKANGKYDTQLRYPAESGVYEKEKMDKLGL